MRFAAIYRLFGDMRLRQAPRRCLNRAGRLEPGRSGSAGCGRLRAQIVAFRWISVFARQRVDQKQVSPPLTPSPPRFQTWRLAGEAAFSRAYLKRTNTASRGQGALNRRVGESLPRAPHPHSRRERVLSRPLGRSEAKAVQGLFGFIFGQGRGQRRRRQPSSSTRLSKDNRVCVLPVGCGSGPVPWPVSR